MNPKINNSICFIANYSKTYLFHEIAQRLIQKGENICWITVNVELYNFLCKEYGKEKVLLINRDNIDQPNSEIDEFKINELVYGDRVLRYEFQNGIRFLTNIQRPIYDFLVFNDVRFAFGEITWAHEILIHRMLTNRVELNAKFLNPHVVRLPNKRWAFFKDERQSQIYEVRNEYPEVKSIEVKKPFYLKVNDKRLKKSNSIKGRLDRIKRWLTNENIDKKDPAHITKGKTRLVLKSQEEFNKEIYRVVKRIDFELIKNVPYVFVGLHKQPEASVDAFGRYYEDQYLNICNLWRAIPSGWNILVKEHTNAIGDRDLSFYNKLIEMPGIHFVHESTDSYSLISNAQLVATITGTIAYEAALMKIPAVTFAPTFFNQINYCEQIGLTDLDRCTSLKEIADRLRDQIDNRAKFSSYLMANSFEGILVDPVSMPSVMDEENIEMLCQPFLNIVQNQLELNIA
ncbi:MAG: hypothetical protein AB8H03_00935 [Saprospiraceae bacterium]